MPDKIVVLYVDDSTVSLAIRGELLSEFDKITVITESSPIAALDLLDTADIDCVLSDFAMPEQDGLAFLDAVRTEYPAIPFILFTGQESSELADNALEAGVTDFVPKSLCSISYRLVANRIEKAVSHYRARQQLQNI